MPQLCGEASLASKQMDCSPKPRSLCISEDPQKTCFELRDPRTFCRACEGTRASGLTGDTTEL